MFIETLFVVGKNWKLTKYPLTGEWINKHGISMQWNTA